MPIRKPKATDPDSFDGWQAGLTEREKRIDEVVQKMQSGAWLSGVSERALAKEWNLSPETVRKISVEASRVVRRTLREDPEARAEARAQIMQTFEVIRAKAMAKGDPQALRVALDATRALGFYLGVEPAKKLDVHERTDPFEGWTTDEKAAFARDGLRPRRALREMSMANGHADAADDEAEKVH